MEIIKKLSLCGYLLFIFNIVCFSNSTFAWSATSVGNGTGEPKYWEITCADNETYTYSGSADGLSIVGPALCPGGVVNLAPTPTPQLLPNLNISCDNNNDIFQISATDELFLESTGNILCPNESVEVFIAPTLPIPALIIFASLLVGLGAFIRR